MRALDQSFPTQAASGAAFRLGFDAAVAGEICPVHFSNNGWLLNSLLVGYVGGLDEISHRRSWAKLMADVAFDPADAEWGE
jgi:hypothetical protein